MNGFLLYLKMLRQSIRGQMQYGASFVMYVTGTLLGGLIEFAGIWAMFTRFGRLGMWTLWDIGVFYGMGNIAFALCEMFMRAFDTFSKYVRQGDFDRMLLRPRSTVLQMLGAECQVMRIGRLLQGAAVLAISLGRLDVSWWGAGEWLLLLASIGSGALLFSGLIILQAVSTFWTVESLEVFNSFTYGGVTAVQYPLDIYERPLRFLFTYLLPLAAMSYWPCSLLLGRGYVSAFLSMVSPLVGPAFLTLCLCAWRFGVRHYRSTGS